MNGGRTQKDQDDSLYEIQSIKQESPNDNEIQRLKAEGQFLNFNDVIDVPKQQK